LPNWFLQIWIRLYTVKKIAGNSNLNIFHICSYPHLWFLSFFTRSIQKLSFRCLFCFELMCLFLFMWHVFFYCCVLSKTNSIIFDCAFFSIFHNYFLSQFSHKEASKYRLWRNSTAGKKLARLNSRRQNL